MTENSFYGVSKGHYDIILVSEEKDKGGNVSANSLTEISVWFAKALAFVRTKS